MGAFKLVCTRVMTVSDIAVVIQDDLASNWAWVIQSGFDLGDHRCGLD